MDSTPMELCTALGVLTSEPSEGSSTGKVLMFDTRLSMIVASGLTMPPFRRTCVERVECHGRTGAPTSGVFDQNIRTAVDARLAQKR
jgi:hypothetical protein